MAQIKSNYPEGRVPFAKMSWTPDIPPTALQPTEYNHGYNVETDTRGIRSVFGDQEILSQITGTPVYITGGYREDGDFYYIVAAVENTTEGRWYQIAADGTQTNITPGYGASPTAYLAGYSTDVNITEAWNGTTLIVNDAINPPMYLSGSSVELEMYKNNATMNVGNIYFADAATIIIEFTEPINVQYQAFERLVVSNVLNPTVWNGTYTAINQPSYSIVEVYDTTPTRASWAGTGSVTAGTLTVNTTFSGAIVVGQYITGNDPDWGLNPGTTVDVDLGGGQYTLSNAVTTTINPDDMVTWEGFISGGTVRPEYQWNYNIDWVSLTAGFVRAFQSPNVGTVLIAGNLTATDVNTTTLNFPTTVRWSQNFGLNTVPATWDVTITNVANELEVPVRGPVLDGFPCNGNFFVCSYWDTVIFAPIAYQTTQVPIFGVRLFNQGRGLLQSNCWANADDTVYGVDARDFWVFDGQNFRPLGNQRVKNYFFDNLNATYVDKVFVEMNTQKNQVEFYYPDADSTGFANKMISYRFDFDCFNPPRDMPDIIMACESPILRDATPDYFDYGSRCIAFVSAVADSKIIQKDQGYAFANGDPIASLFQRDAIHLSKDFSTKAMTHRILPEVNTINEYGQVTTSAGTITVTVGGSNSAGAAVTYKPQVVMNVATDQPWIQVDQNAYRLQSIKIEHSSTTDAYICSAVSWQFTEVEDDR